MIGISKQAKIKREEEGREGSESKENIAES